MNNKIQYKDFFGLKEQAVATTTGLSVAPDKLTDPNVQAQIKKGVKVRVEGEIDEAQLLNHITDYKGGVEYVLVDPATAINVADEIKQFAAKKRIDIIKFKMSSSGTVGYFLFKLGEDAAKESQQIQGYISQKPEVKHFRFNVRQQKQSLEQSRDQSM
jgi:hypothetical protein